MDVTATAERDTAQDQGAAAQQQAPMSYQEGAAGGGDGTAPETGPTGRRAGLLQDSFERCLAYSLKPDPQAFRAAFPTLPGPAVQALFAVYQQVLSHVHEHSHAEFQSICSEHNVAEALSTLEHADEEASASASDAVAAAEASASTGAGVEGAAEASARVFALQQEKEQLQLLLDKMMGAERRLRETLSARSAQMAKAQTHLDVAVRDVRQVSDVAKAWPLAQATAQ